MQYVSLGRTGLYVSRICLGCMSYGSPTWRPWILDEAAARPLFRAARDAGINFFDTADMYSMGVSEEVTGRILRELGRLEELVIATKVYFPMADGPNMRGLGRKHIVQACEASLRRLGIETIDLYQIHRFDENTPVEETLGALDQLVRQGKVRHLGASSMASWRLMKMLSVSERNGWARFVSMQNHYNLLYREEEREMMPLCRAEGVGVIPWSPLARGLLAARSGTAREQSDTYTPMLYGQPGEAEIIDAVRRVAEARGVSPAEVALAWLLSKEGVTAPIVGATKLPHLEAAVRAVSLKLTDDERKTLEAPYKPREVRGH
jgi:aryl-alcohol dehydrogenase-like predicted oxidoreductase